jgi:hypothetical protein
MLWKINFIINWVSNSVTEFERKIKNITHLQTRPLLNQERHLALEAPTSEMAHAYRGREKANLQNNIMTKPKQLKLSKTNPPTWP